MNETQPGFAKRHDNYAFIHQASEQQRSYYNEKTSVKIYKSKLYEIITRCLGDLPIGEQRLLHCYVGFLNIKELSEGNSYVWPSTKLVTNFLKSSAKTVQRHKSRLEGRGLIIRNFDYRNRPSEY